MEAERYTVAVDGGDLAVGRWGDGAAVVIAAHGITASHLAWAGVGAHVRNDLTLIAPDLRGRGDSGDLPGPYGMAQHARDLLAVLDHAGAQRAIVAGHSMGGFVASVFAGAYPERTAAVVLVDGGPAIGEPLPDDVDVDVVLARVIGPALDRLERRFTSRAEYRAFWREHPAFVDTGADLERLDAYADHDLHGPEGDLRSKVDAGAVRADGRDTLINPAMREAVGRIAAPAVLLLAERGMLNDQTPLFPRGSVTGLRTQRGPLEVIRVPATNHYTILAGDIGARAVAHHLRGFAAAGAAGRA
jgi:pimeloyl-ACP methyl ester carboxylesterase